MSDPGSLLSAPTITILWLVMFSLPVTHLVLIDAFGLNDIAFAPVWAVRNKEGNPDAARQAHEGWL